MNILGYFQRLGKALMLPIAVLPIAGLMLRLGQPDLLGDYGFAWMAVAGDAVFGKLSLIFALGIAVGLAKDEHGAAAVAGAVGWFVLEAVAKHFDTGIKFGTFSGIIIGIVAGHTYNTFHSVKLPSYLAFFGGKRLVPIMTGIFALLLGIALGFVWPPVQNVINAFGNLVVASGAVGEFSYGFLNRLLIPVGLHHVLNTIFWFTIGDCVKLTYELAGAVQTYCANPELASSLIVGGTLADVPGSVITAISTDHVNGDLWRFFAGDPAAGKFMAGFFPVMMFGLPGAALAMYFAAPKHRRPEAGGILFSVAFTAMLTGVTEPFEFLFVFLAPALYAVHAALTGVSLVVSNLLGTLHGFTFSAGILDFLLNWGIATKPALLLVQGAVWFVVYFVLFTFAIRTFNLKTPGREDEEPVLATSAGTATATAGDDVYVARQYMLALGGYRNIVSIDACITRLRLTVKDRSAIDESVFKRLGAKGVVKLGEQNLQIILGPQAEIIAAAMKTIPASDALTDVQLP